MAVFSYMYSVTQKHPTPTTSTTPNVGVAGVVGVG